MDGQHKFFRLKIPSSYISDPHLQFMSANSLEKNDVVVAISQSGTTAALIDSVKIVRKNGVKVIGIMPGNTPLANVCDFPLTIDVGINNRISKPVTSRIAYTAIIDVLTMGVAQLKPEAQEHLYNIADSQRSLKVDNKYIADSLNQRLTAHFSPATTGEPACNASGLISVVPSIQL